MTNLIENLDLGKFDNAQWIAQESNNKSILFYHLADTDHKNIEKCKKHLEQTTFYKCYLSSACDIGIPSVVGLSLENYLETQEQVLNYLYPIEDNLLLLGVTGTNGKTTTVDLVRQLCVLSGIQVLTLGTLGVFLNDKEVENFNLTTPNYIDLRKTIFRFKNDIKVCAMELSSHALAQHRVGRLYFDNIGWTNFTQDHLDYHNTMDEYLEVKKGVFNLIKPAGKIILPRRQKPLGKLLNRPSEIIYGDLTLDPKNLFFSTDYNKDNLELALAMVEPLVSSIKLETLEKIKATPGRFNIIKYKNSFIVIDYAHTPDALESICHELKDTFKEYELITVFGCGGNRDRAKRPIMASAAQKFSEMVILTSDNPRMEDPNKIIADAEVGLSGKYLTILDRKDAISKGISLLQKSVLLIAGKGHENYIDIKGKKVSYSDKETVMGIIND